MKNLFLALSIVSLIPGQAFATAPKPSWSEQAYGITSAVSWLIALGCFGAIQKKADGRNLWNYSILANSSAPNPSGLLCIVGFSSAAVGAITGYLTYRQEKERAEALHLK